MMGLVWALIGGFSCFGYVLIGGMLLVLICCFRLSVLGGFAVICEVGYDTLFKICVVLCCGCI